MKEVINSVGIDIGTSTTQLIFSKLTIENMATSYTVPRISIVDTEVVYKSDIYFTPLDCIKYRYGKSKKNSYGRIRQSRHEA